MRFTHNGKEYKTIEKDNGLGIEYTVYTAAGEPVLSTVIGYDMLGSVCALRDELDALHGTRESNLIKSKQLEASFNRLSLKERKRLNNLVEYVNDIYTMPGGSLTDFECDTGVITLDWVESFNDIVEAATDDNVVIDANGWDVYSFVAYDLVNHMPMTLALYERHVKRHTRSVLEESILTGEIKTEIVDNGDELNLRYWVDGKPTDIELINTVTNINEMIDLVQESMIRG